MSLDTSENIEKFASDSMAEYAREVILNRAIPDARDGLKPVQRAIMWQTVLSNLTPTARHVKVSKLSGLVLGNFHPHGSDSIDGSIVKLSQNWVRRMPLIDIHGNNGSVDGRGAAAARYIECRQAPAASFMTEGVNENAVDMVPNYDSTMEMPEVMPARLPIALVNGTSGIALAMATSILPHNPVEIAQLMLLEAKGELTFENAKKIWLGPDFPTGNEILGVDPAAELESSSFSCKIRARSHIDGTDIIVTETPFNTNVTKLIESLAKVANRIKEVKAIDDETETFPNVRVIIRCAKSTSPERMRDIQAYLENRSDLTKTVSANNLLISDHAPRYMSVIEQIKAFMVFRGETLARIWQHRLDSALARQALVMAEKIAVEKITLIKDLLEESADPADFKSQLMSNLGFDEIAADHVARMSLMRLIKNDKSRIEAISKELDRLYTTIMELRSNLGANRRQALIDDVEETLAMLKELKYERLTTLSDERHSAREVIEVVVDKSSKNVYASTISAETSTTPIDKCLSLEGVPGDHFVAAFTQDGLAVVRRASEFENERTNRTVSGITSDSRFIALADLTSSSHIVTISKRGYVKRIDAHKLLPAGKTRRYLKKSQTVSGLKGGNDTLLAVMVYNTLTDDDQIIIELDRRRKPEAIISGKDLLARDDNGGSSGARLLNTHDGADRVVNIKKG
jgi:DNA gyrase/topoisomerase IV subunit A